MKKISFTLLALVALLSATAQHRSTFDDLSLPANSVWTGVDQSGGFLDGDAYFRNFYDTAYGGFWSSGFAYSNVAVNIDTITTAASDYSYQYNSAAGKGASGSNTFGMCYTGSAATIRLQGFASGHEVYGMYVTNSAYSYLSMKYGDAFGKKFGGSTGTDPDWFRLTIRGWYQGVPTTNSVEVYLADFRSADTTQHYILKTWKFIDLLTLGNVDSLTFRLNSSDTAGGYGMNTPAYFNLDNLLTTDGVSYAAPGVVNDSFAFVYMDTITGNADTLTANILANDNLSSFLSQTVSLVSSPIIIGASAHLDANNNLIYIPAAGVSATDTLYYAVCDEVGTCDTAQVLVHVLGPRNTGTGIIDISTSDLYLYPNPARSYVSISYTSEISTVSIEDMSGREIIATDIHKNTASVNIQSLSPGVYTVMIHTSEGTAVRRLVKE